jgi:hypothetical protein
MAEDLLSGDALWQALRAYAQWQYPEAEVRLDGHCLYGTLEPQRPWEFVGTVADVAEAQRLIDDLF